MRGPVHRIRAAHGYEHLRYASDPSNKECALRRLSRPRAVGASAEAPKKAGKLMLSSDPIGSNGRITVVDRTPGMPGVERRRGRPGSSRHCEAVKGVKPRWRANSSLAKINDQ